MDDFVVIKVQGEVVDVLCNINPEYTKYVVTEQGVKIMYMQLKKALYGTMKAAVKFEALRQIWEYLIPRGPYIGLPPTLFCN